MICRGAEITIQRFCGQSDHGPKNISYALNQLADWHLQLAKDRDAAQRALEKNHRITAGDGNVPAGSATDRALGRHGKPCWRRMIAGG